MTDIEKIATHYKLGRQLLKLVEEMAELTKEIIKYKLPDSETDKDYCCNIPISSELAEIRVLIEQVIYLMDNESCVAKIEEYKVKRQLERMGANITDFPEVLP